MKAVFLLFISLIVVCCYKVQGNRIPTNISISYTCFDTFSRRIQFLTFEASKAADACAAAAGSETKYEIALINQTRSDIFSEVQRIQTTLSSCSMQYADHIGYFECLKEIVENDRRLVGDITSKSSEYSQKLNQIKKGEIKCFREMISDLQDKTSKTNYNLELCLISGEQQEPNSEKAHYNA